MRAWIEQINATHEAHVYAAEKDDLLVVADHCKRLQNDNQTGDNDLRVLGHVPGFIIQKYCNENQIGFKEFMRNADHQKRLLMDPDLSAFRVYKGTF